MALLNVESKSLPYGLSAQASRFQILVRLLQKGSGERGRRPFTLPKLARLLAVADPEWKSLVLFGFYTGQRLGDLARLTWANVDLERQELHFTAGKRDAGRFFHWQPCCCVIWKACLPVTI